MNIIELPDAFDWHKQPMTGWYGHVYTKEQMLEYAALVRAAALEEAAQKCDDLWQDDGTAYDCREALRALKEQA